MKKFGLDFDIVPIGQAHGKLYDAEAEYGKIKIVALYHPAVAVYNRSSLDVLKHDFQILRNI